MFPLTLTRYDKDPYPNGVQDLPKKIKEKIRKGADCSAFVLGTGDDATPVVPRGTCSSDWSLVAVQWRASYDILRFEWRLNHKTLFVNSRAVERIRSVEQGISTMVQTTKASPKPSRCCVLTFGSTPDSPTGDECTLVSATSKACCKFVLMAREWSKAAESGME